MSRLNFILEKEADGSCARAGRFTTLHGEVLTPIFMPVGTQATVKSQNVESLKAMGSRVLLANTYHLLLRPGIEVFRKFGGIHKFMNWDMPVLTDSGGFQIFSLPNSRNLKEEGAVFRSYIDGRSILLSPELSIETQKAINSDIMMVLDQCVPSTVEYALAKSAMELTYRWAKRSLAARGDSKQALFGIVQGACFKDLRKQSADALTQLSFDGFAIGGLAVGETKEERNDFCELSASLLPKNLPRYLMGVGTPIDLLEAVHRGVDMFDCILPVEQAQRGVAFTSIGKLQMRRGIYKLDDTALDPNCSCPCCASYSRSYLHHLTKSNEILGWQLMAIHNLKFYHGLMADMRNAILDNTFSSFYKIKKEELIQTDGNPPLSAFAKGGSLRLPRAEKRKRLGDYEIIENEKGFWSVKQRSSGETMHSVSNPMVEAKELYIDQSNLSERLATSNHKEEMNEDAEPFIIWDVGLGAATNAMAAIVCHESISNPRAMHLISFESDLDPLKLAIKNAGRFPHLYHKAPRKLLERSIWQSDSGLITWNLIFGDFAVLFSSQKIPDLIFYDPFSFKTDSLLWKAEFFQRIFNHCKASEKTTTLYTYSASTAVRSALLHAGFWVGKGIGIGPKLDTTIAFSKAPESELEKKNLLSSEWLSRREKSYARYPQELDVKSQASWDAKILNHPQFC
ncbi:MAG: tRNA guanosine(34) transglycosylase Tgt [Leptospiraceae bacterium]|nr:tRNA guanosine(34) transglycosylase Tgt [Leptospiraceae bacterium]